MSDHDREAALAQAREYSRGMTCGRCEEPTGNNHQGHYWAFCKVTRQIEDFHFCCPGNCQLHPDHPDFPVGGGAR